MWSYLGTVDLRVDERLSEECLSDNPQLSVDDKFTELRGVEKSRLAQGHAEFIASLFQIAAKNDVVTLAEPGIETM